MTSMRGAVLRLAVAVTALAVASILAITAMGAGPGRANGEIEGRARFGVIEPHHASQRADELGAGWGRARFHWATIQPGGPAEWLNPELTDAELTGELEAGREVIGLLIGVPEWARDASGLPAGLYLAPDDPGNLWAAFVTQAVSRYAGEIDHWIIWNEPDVWDTSHPAFTWPGDEADYVQLLRTAYIAARAANPQAVIHLAAVSHWWDASYGRELYFPRLLDAILADSEAARYNYYHDAATLQLYFNPASVVEIVEEYRGYQLERGLDRPIWLIETNAAPSSDPAWPVVEPTFRVSLLEQAAYMPQALSLSLAAGVERVGIYKLIDTPGDVAANPEPFGLVREDGTPRPAFETARVAIEVLSGVERATWNERHIVSQVVAERPGQVVRILWTRIPQAQSVRIPALGSAVRAMDMWGNPLSLDQPEAGVYRLDLFAGECQQTTGDYCMIGGPPVYVIEDVAADGDLLAQDELPGILSFEAMPPLGSEVSRARPAWLGALAGLGMVGLGVLGLALRRRFLNMQRGWD